MSYVPAPIPTPSHKRLHSDAVPEVYKKAKTKMPLPPLGRPIRTEFVLSSIKAPTSGYTAGTKPARPKTDKLAPEENLENLRARSWTYIRWGGNEARPLLDRQNRSFAILAGIPPGEIYQGHCAGARKLMTKLADKVSFTKEQCDHIRGLFPALNVGAAFGPGQSKPHNLSIVPAQQKIADELLADPSIGYLAEMQSGKYNCNYDIISQVHQVVAMFKQWVPKLHEFYDSNLGTIWSNLPELKRNFPGSVWPVAAFNLSRKVASRRHRDSQNLLYGICAITSLGSFDASKGGHLVLPDLEMVIEFPAGAIILIPSALLEHANTPIGEDEERLSFTQYSAGGHFRYVDWDCRTMKETRMVDAARYSELQQETETNATKGWGMYSTWDELGTYSVL
jgi:hypothetical protein